MSTQHVGAPVRLPDDREEDLVGTDWHQQAIVGVFDGLLDLARIEAGRLQLESMPLALPDFLEEVVRMVRPQAESKGLAFVYTSMHAVRCCASMWSTPASAWRRKTTNASSCPSSAVRLAGGTAANPAPASGSPSPVS